MFDYEKCGKHVPYWREGLGNAHLWGARWDSNIFC